MKDTLVGAIFVGVLAIVLVAFVGVFAAIPTYFLWNWLMPVIFGLKEVTFWQAWGLVFLSGILVKSTATSSK